MSILTIRLPLAKRLVQYTGLLAAFGLSACSTINFKTKPEHITEQGLLSANVLRQTTNLAVSAFADTGAALIRSASQLDKSGNKLEAAGCYLKAAIDARALIESGSEAPGSAAEKALLDLHNKSLARFAEIWMTASQKDGTIAQVTCGSDTLQIHVAKNSTYQPGYFDRVIAAESVTVKNIARKGRSGLGGALAGIREQRPDRAQEMEFYPPRGLHVPVTMTLDNVRKTPGATAVTVSLRNPLVEQQVALGRRSFPVAADFSAPVAVLLAGRSDLTWGLEGFFKAEERKQIAGIYLTEPYDPNRIPVLFIHGLVSVPSIWRDVFAEMLDDPEIARRYQFLVFAYPSSYPVAESAALLRDELAAVRKRYDPNGNDPLSRNLVVAGHSMGGILTHTLITEFGDNLWKQFSDTPLDDLPIPAEKKAEMRRLAYFKPDPGVTRAIFFSAPHRGANMAESGMAGLVSRTASLPGELVQATVTPAGKAAAHDLGLKVDLDKKVTSVQSLQPGAPVVAAMDISPIKKGVPYHSVIGDRGKGDTPNSSDGVVEYWSSHLDGAASELIVPSGHGSYCHPLAIKEFDRILRLHAGVR